MSFYFTGKFSPFTEINATIFQLYSIINVVEIN